MIYHSKKIHKKFQAPQRGFIALITVIIISAVLLGLVSAANTAGYASRFSALNVEYKRSAFALAESCSNVALMRLDQNYLYTLPQSMQIVLGTDTCTITSITEVSALPSSRTVLITSSAHYMEAFSTVEVEATIANPGAAGSSARAVTIISWQETQ